MALSIPLVASPVESDDDGNHELHRRLARRNQHRLSPALFSDTNSADLRAEADDRHAEELFVASERVAVRASLSRDDVPSDPDGFVSWFERLRETGPGQGDPLFPWLAEECSLQQMRWFLGQEVAGEAGFEDLLALTQLKMPIQTKLEMARNYWDEMGRGRPAGMHGPMLDRLTERLSARLPISETIWESLALGNLMVALAWNRHYAYQAIGALGVIELTAPGRARHVNAGLRRLGVSGGARRYFAVHATLDVKHSIAWNREILRPLVAADARIATAIAEGALMRLRAGARCFAAYRACSCLPGADVTASRVTADAADPWR